MQIQESAFCAQGTKWTKGQEDHGGFTYVHKFFDSPLNSPPLEHGLSGSLPAHRIRQTWCHVTREARSQKGRLTPKHSLWDHSLWEKSATVSKQSWERPMWRGTETSDQRRAQKLLQSRPSSPSNLRRNPKAEAPSGGPSKFLTHRH